MVRKIMTAITLAAMCMALAVRAQAADDESAQSDFFREGTSARSFGLGSAFVGLADDVNAVYWNPAGLANLKAPQILTTKTKLDFFDSDVQAISAAAPYGKGVWGINYVYSSTDIPLFGPNPSEPARLDYPLGIASERYTGLSLGYGMQWKRNLALGVNFKSMKYTLFGNSSSGTGFDVAALMKTSYLNGAMLGVNLQNVGGVKLGAMDKVPFNVEVGISKKYSGDKLVVALGYDSNYLGTSAMSAGAEYKIAEHFTARAGVRDKKLAYGFSVNVDSFSLDYALNSGSSGSNESETNKLSITYFFTPGAPKPPATSSKPAEKKMEPPATTAKKEEKKEPTAEEKAAEKKKADEKAAADKKKAEEKAAADKKKAEEKAAADKKKAEEKAAADKKKAEEKAAADKKKAEEEAAAQKAATDKQTINVVNDTGAEGQPQVVLPSIYELLGETGPGSAPNAAPTVYLPPERVPEPQRYPVEQGQFGLSNEYDGQLP